MSSENITKILLVEDYWLIRKSIKSGLHRYGSLRFVAEAENSFQALEHLESMSIDLIIMDYQLTDNSLWGVELTKEILKKYPKIKIIFWSIHTREIDVISAMKVGAHGYLSKQSTDDEIKAAIEKVMRGDTAWPFDLESKIQKRKGLSPMKMKVIGLLSQGMGYKQIAYDLLIEEYNKKISRFGVDRVLEEFGTFDKYIMQKCTFSKSDGEKLEKRSNTRLDSRKRTVEGYATAIKKWFGAKSLCMLGKKIIQEGRLEYRRISSN